MPKELYVCNAAGQYKTRCHKCILAYGLDRTCLEKEDNQSKLGYTHSSIDYEVISIRVFQNPMINEKEIGALSCRKWWWKSMRPLEHSDYCRRLLNEKKKKWEG